LVLDEDIPFDKPEQLNSIPRTKQPGEKSDDQPLDWSRYPGGKKPQGEDDEDLLFDRPGDVRYVPRDGRPLDSDSPEYEWNRQPPGRSLVFQTKMFHSRGLVV
jgi:hypothetical protein